MNLLQELVQMIPLTEDKGTVPVSRSTRATVYHADYVKTKKKKYRKYHPVSKPSTE